MVTPDLGVDNPLYLLLGQGGCNPLAGVGQVGEQVGDADPHGSGGSALQTMADNVAGLGLVTSDVADGTATVSDAPG
jgi:hypothetical protein